MWNNKIAFFSILSEYSLQSFYFPVFPVQLLIRPARFGLRFDHDDMGPPALVKSNEKIDILLISPKRVFSALVVFGVTNIFPVSFIEKTGKFFGETESHLYPVHMVIHRDERIRRNAGLREAAAKALLEIFPKLVIQGKCALS